MEKGITENKEIEKNNKEIKINDIYKDSKSDKIKKTNDKLESKDINYKETKEKKIETRINMQIPLLKINKVTNRLLFLSPTVISGLERECNKRDFYREGENCIGKGAFGEVWKVVHKATNNLYVIKVMDKHRINENNLTEQINREIEIMYKLNHPHVMRLINHFEDNDKFYLIMPYASKGQLYSLLRRQVRFDQRTAAQYVREVIEAVRYLHSFSPKIIHRDIKPENLLLDENYRVILSDFGWSNFYNENEPRYTFCGTPEYLSPEMAKKSGHNEMVDIWAIGVLLFEFLSGFAPFTGADQNELYSNIKKLKVSWPSDFPKSAKNLVSQILKLNPSERLSLEEISNHGWFKANPPLRPVLNNYLTDEKDILKSHLINVKPESIEEKLNELTDPNKKRKFRSVHFPPRKKEIKAKNENDENLQLNDMNNVIYHSTLNENFMLLKKEKALLETKYEELVNKIKNYENDIIPKLEKENKSLKEAKVIVSNNKIYLLENEIKKYKIISEERENLIKEMDEIKNNNNKLMVENEILKNSINIIKNKTEELNKKLLILKKKNKNNINEIEELSKKLKYNSNNYTNFNLDLKDINLFSNEIKKIIEEFKEQINNNTSSIRENISNIESKIEGDISNKILNCLKNEENSFVVLLNRINNEYNKNIFTFPEIVNKEIQNLKAKLKIEEEKFNSLNSKNILIEEKIKSISNEKKLFEDLNTQKENEITKLKQKINNLNFRINDINRYINENSTDKIFKKKFNNIWKIGEMKEEK